MDLRQEQEQLAGVAFRFRIDFAIDDRQGRVQVPGQTVDAFLEAARECFVGKERAVRVGEIQAQRG